MTISTSSCQIPFMMLEEPQIKVVRRERESRSFIYNYNYNSSVPSVCSLRPILIKTQAFLRPCGTWVLTILAQFARFAQFVRLAPLACLALIASPVLPASPNF